MKGKSVQEKTCSSNKAKVICEFGRVLQAIVCSLILLEPPHTDESRMWSTTVPDTLLLLGHFRPIQKTLVTFI